MKHFTESLQDEARAQKLTPAEREAMRARLHAFQEEYPAYTKSPLFAVPVRFPFEFSYRAVYAFAALILVIGVTGGTALAAQGTLPGDVLYPVKVSVNEPVEGVLALSTQAKAQWNADIAAERLKEAAALSAEGRLTASTSVELADAFTVHAAEAATITNDLRTEDPTRAAKLATSFSAAVAAQSSAILAGSSEGNSKDNVAASNAFVRAILAQKVNNDTNEIAMAAADEDTGDEGAADSATHTDATATASSEIAMNTAPVAKTSAPVQPSTTAKKMMATMMAPATLAVSVTASAAPATVTVSVPEAPSLDDAFAEKMQQLTSFLEENRGSLTASTSAYADAQLADIHLVPIQVQADRSNDDESSATHDLMAGISRAQHLYGFLRVQVRHASSSMTRHSATTTDEE